MLLSLARASLIPGLAHQHTISISSIRRLTLFLSQTRVAHWSRTPRKF